MDDNYKAALLRWRSVTINMQRTVHIGDASIELDPTGYAYKSKGNMTDDDYHNLFVLQQQYHSFTGRAKRDRAQTMQVENRDTGKKNALRANEQSTKTRKKRNCFMNKAKTNASGLRWNTNTRDALRLTHKHTLHVIIITYTHLYRMA